MATALNKRQYGLHLAQARGQGIALSFGPIQFKPGEHPRDLRGRFKDTLAKLKVGQKVELPDGIGIQRRQNDPANVKHGGVKSLLYVSTSGNQSTWSPTIGPDDAAMVALARSARSDHPQSLGGTKSFLSVSAAAKAHGASGSIDNLVKEPMRDVRKPQHGGGKDRAQAARVKAAREYKYVPKSNAQTGGTRNQRLMGKAGLGSRAKSLKARGMDRKHPEVVSREMDNQLQELDAKIAKLSRAGAPESAFKPLRKQRKDLEKKRADAFNEENAAKKVAIRGHSGDIEVRQKLSPDQKERQRQRDRENAKITQANLRMNKPALDKQKADLELKRQLHQAREVVKRAENLGRPGAMQRADKRLRELEAFKRDRDKGLDRKHPEVVAREKAQAEAPMEPKFFAREAAAKKAAIARADAPAKKPTDKFGKPQAETLGRDNWAILNEANIEAGGGLPIPEEENLGEWQLRELTDSRDEITSYISNSGDEYAIANAKDALAMLDQEIKRRESNLDEKRRQIQDKARKNNARRIRQKP